MSEEVKQHLETLEEEQHNAALARDIRNLPQEPPQIVDPVREVPVETPLIRRVKFVDEVEKAKDEAAKPYDVVKDVTACPSTATLGQLLRDNPSYRRQLRSLLVGKRRRRKLPPVGNIADVRSVSEDLGSPEVDIQINGCSIPFVTIDGGSGVNLIVESTAHSLGFDKFESTLRTLRLADGARVLPVGILSNIPTLIGGISYPLNYLVLRPRRPSTFPILIGRPWLYKAKVIEDWGAKEFRFGKPEVSISWEKVDHLGESALQEEEYDSSFAGDTSEVEDEVFWLEAVTQLTEADIMKGPVAGSDPQPETKTTKSKEGADAPVPNSSIERQFQPEKLYKGEFGQPEPDGSLGIREEGTARDQGSGTMQAKEGADAIAPSIASVENSKGKGKAVQWMADPKANTTAEVSGSDSGSGTQNPNEASTSTQPETENLDGVGASD